MIVRRLILPQTPKAVRAITIIILIHKPKIILTEIPIMQIPKAITKALVPLKTAQIQTIRILIIMTAVQNQATTVPKKAIAVQNQAAMTLRKVKAAVQTADS